MGTPSGSMNTCICEYSTDVQVFREEFLGSTGTPRRKSSSKWGVGFIKFFEKKHARIGKNWVGWVNFPYWGDFTIPSWDFFLTPLVNLRKIKT